MRKSDKERTLALVVFLTTAACGQIEHTIGTVASEGVSVPDTSVPELYADASGVQDSHVEGASDGGGGSGSEDGDSDLAAGDAGEDAATESIACVVRELRPGLGIYIMMDDTLTMDPSYLPYPPGTVDLSWLFAAARDEVVSFVYNPANQGVGVGIRFYGAQCDQAAYATPAVAVEPLDSQNVQASAIDRAFDAYRPSLYYALAEPYPALQAAIAYARSRAAQPARPASKQVVFLITTQISPAVVSGCMYDFQDLNAAAEAGFEGKPSVETYVIAVSLFNPDPRLVSAWFDQLTQIAQYGGGQAFQANISQQQVDLSEQMQKARVAATCAYDLPDEFDALPVYPEYVGVRYEPEGGSPVRLDKVSGSSGCGSAAGWYFEDPARPRRIVLCPATCDLFQSTAASKKPPQLVLVFDCPPGDDV